MKNSVRVQFKNSDQKRIPISSSSTFVFTMFDALNRRQLLQKQLVVLDDGTLPLRGLAQLTFSESDTVDLDVSSYHFSITYQDSDGSFVPAYANTYYGIRGTLVLAQDIYPVLQPSQVISAFLRDFNHETNLYEHLSGNVYAYPEYNNNTALHTMAIYMTNFKGTVYVQGTLNNQPDNTDYYHTVVSLDYDGFSGIDYVNFNGIYSYVRIKFVPAADPVTNLNDDPDYWGSVDKVLYRY